MSAAAPSGTPAPSGGSGGTGGVAGTPAPNAGQPAPKAPEWLASLGDADLGADPTLNRFADVPTLARSYVELNKKIGAKGLIVPSKDARPEDHAAFWRELGMPEKADGYTPPEGYQPPADVPIDDNFVNAMRQMAHKAKIPKAAWDELYQGYIAYQAGEYAKVKATYDGSKEQGLSALKQAWGNAFDAKLQGANRALDHVFGKDFAAVKTVLLADGTPLGNHPLFIRAFADLFDQMNEAKLVEGAAPRVSMTRDEAEREIKRLSADAGFLAAWRDKAHPEHEAAVERRRTLYEIASGSGADQAGSATGMPVTGGARVGR